MHLVLGVILEKPKDLSKLAKKEHIRNVKYCNNGFNVAKHAWTYDHKIDFKNARIIDKATNGTRITLESWHTARTNNADNNSFYSAGTIQHSLKQTLSLHFRLLFILSLN